MHFLNDANHFRAHHSACKASAAFCGEPDYSCQGWNLSSALSWACWVSWDLRLFVVNIILINLIFVGSLRSSTCFPDHFQTHWTPWTLIPVGLHWWSSSLVKIHPLVVSFFANIKLLFNSLRFLPVVSGCLVYLRAFDETFRAWGFCKLGGSWKYRENFSAGSVLFTCFWLLQRSPADLGGSDSFYKSCLLFLNVLLLFMYSLILVFTRASANMRIRISDLWFLELPLDLVFKKLFSY